MKELRFNKQKISEELIMQKNFKNKYFYPSGPPRIAPTSRAPRRPPLPPLASYATDPKFWEVWIRLLEH